MQARDAWVLRELERRGITRRALLEVCGGIAAFLALPRSSGAEIAEAIVEGAVPGGAHGGDCPIGGKSAPALARKMCGGAAATVAHWPALDGLRRPRFAYAKRIQDGCERRAHCHSGQYVEAWGNEAHRSGHCLYKLEPGNP